MTLYAYASELWRDFIAIEIMSTGVMNLCAAIAEDRADLEKIAVAAVFHDLGSWTNKTFDYIAPSVAVSGEYLAPQGRAEWIAEIETMIVGSERSGCHVSCSSRCSPRGRVPGFIGVL